MADTRIDELRRRLEREPGSRLFAQLAEELRKAGELVEAIRVARAGLAVHSSYPSARLTLGRALLDSGDASGARVELEAALREAPDNILASRFLAQAREALGDLRGAQEQYQRTLQMAPGDAQLQAQLSAVETRLRAAAAAPPPPPATARPTAAAQPLDAASGLAPTVRLPASQPAPAAPPPAPAAPPPPAAARSAVSTPPGSQAPEPLRSPKGDFELAGTAAPGTVQHTWFAPSEVAATAALPATLVDAARSAPQSEPGVPAAPPPQPLPPAIAAFPAPAAAPAPPAPAAAPAPPPAAVARDAPAPPPPPAATEGATPFSSSTLAELYYQQGLVERAVDVYRQLVQQDPANEKARLRLVELETADAPDDRAVRRRALERTIAGLESLLAVVQRR